MLFNPLYLCLFNGLPLLAGRLGGTCVNVGCVPKKVGDSAFL